jgi:hypothetical protein
VHVQVRDQLGAVATGDVAEQPRHVLDAAVEPVDLGVDLDPVAGRHHDRLQDVLGLGHEVRELGGAVGVERHRLQDRDGRAAVRDPDAEDAHEPTTRATTSPMSRGAAPTAPATDLRCSW